MENNMTDHNAKEDKQNFQLPKNIRQIGNVQGAIRIYMEDYVYTYLHGNTRSGWEHKGSIFLGNRYHENGQKYIFVSGIVHIADEFFKEGVPEFTDLMWGSVYQDMKQYYENVEILGWGMDVAGASAKLTGDLERIHRNAFQGQEKILFLMDTLEKEEAFYVYEKNMLRRRDGYYIYYEKNPQMQEYMMRGREESLVQPEIDPQRMIITNYRNIAAEKNKKTGKGFRAFVYVASLALLAAVSAMGVNMISSSGKIHRLEEAVSYMKTDQAKAEQEILEAAEQEKSNEDDTASTMDEATGEDPLIEKEEEPESLLQTESEFTNSSFEDVQKPADEQEEMEEIKDESQEEPKIEEPDNSKSKEEETAEAVELSNKDYYIVEKGESLLGISQKLYGKDRTEELCLLNDLEDENKIYAGQKLLLLNE